MTSSGTASDPTPDGAGRGSPPGSVRVLIAEDFEPVRALTVRLLSKLGQLDVDQVEDGQEAVDALAAKRYDLLLLDLSMPRLSGVDVVRWLQAHPERLEGLTVVVLSAAAHEERPMLNELGVDHVLPKPVRTPQLVDLIDEITAAR